MQPFTACKVFTATTGAARADLGDKVTAWLQAHPDVAVVDAIVTQSSDNAYHCFSITLLTREKGAAEC